MRPLPEKLTNRLTDTLPAVRSAPLGSYEIPHGGLLDSTGILPLSIPAGRIKPATSVGFLFALSTTLTSSTRAMAIGWIFWVDVLVRILTIFFFYPTRQHTLRVVISAAVLCIAWSLYLAPHAPGSSATLYGLGVRIASYFGFKAYLLSAEGSFPDHWRRVSDETNTAADAAGLEKLPSNFPLTKKLWWMADISHSFRMIGWVQEPRGCYPPHPPPSRRAFLWKTFFKLIKNIVIVDFTMSVIALSPAFDYRVHDPTDGPETYLTAVPFLRRVPYVLSFGIGTGAMIDGVHNLGSLVSVGLGSNPTLWPDMWGRWGDAYTVRKLWG